jgi:hypothetical protein
MLPPGVHVRMRIDDGRHHVLAREIYVQRAGWNLDLASRANLRDAPVLDDERGLSMDAQAIHRPFIELSR